MKRFTETIKWQDSWFMDLPSKWKLAWLWALDNCDHAGILDANPRLMAFMIGEPIDGDEFIRSMQGRVTKPKPGKWFIPKFIEFQYGPSLNPENSAHKGVIRKLSDSGIQCPVSIFKAPAKGLQSPCQGAQDKDKDKDKDTDKDKEGSDAVPTSKAKAKGPLQLRAEALMKRRKDTPLDSSEIRAFSKNKVAIELTPEEDWLALEAFYAAPQQETYARKDLAALVNNWNGEIDKAKAWLLLNPGKSRSGSLKAVVTAPEPIGWQQFVNAKLPDCPYATGQPSHGKPWAQVSPDHQRFITDQIKAHG